MDKFEEYKLFVEDTARFSERRQTVNNIYVAVNSIFLTAVTFLVKDAMLSDIWRNFLIILVLSAGLVVCLSWTRLIYSYKKLIKFRIDELRIMENHQKMNDCHRMYHAEDKLFPRDENDNLIPKSGLNISDRELWLPRVFIIVYTLVLIGLIIVSVLSIV